MPQSSSVASALAPAPLPVRALAIVNARVWTGDPRRPWADAVLVGGDRIVAVGSSAEVKKRTDKATRVVDARGFMLAPGFIDAHVQFLAGGFALSSVDVPEPSLEMSLRALGRAMAYVAERGVTSVHHMGGWEDLAVFERAHAMGALRTRISAAVPLSTWERLRDTVATHGRGDDWLRIGGLKGGGVEDLYAWTSGSDKAGLQVMGHAIGDRAVSTQLDVCARVERENGSRDRRFRIEHAQHIAPADLPRFARLGVIASMQPYHAIDDERKADKVVGPERAKGAYAFRSLLDAGATLAFGGGSDWFVAPASPLLGIYAATTGRISDEERPGEWVPEQKIRVDEALRAYSSGAARAGFQETQLGIIAPGMLADLVLIDRDLTRIAPETIRDAQVMLTTVGGRVVYDRSGLTH